MHFFWDVTKLHVLANTCEHVLKGVLHCSGLLCINLLDGFKLDGVGEDPAFLIIFTLEVIAEVVVATIVVISIVNASYY